MNREKILEAIKWLNYRATKTLGAMASIENERAIEFLQKEYDVLDAAIDVLKEVERIIPLTTNKTEKTQLYIEVPCEIGTPIYFVHDGRITDGYVSRYQINKNGTMFAMRRPKGGLCGVWDVKLINNRMFYTNLRDAETELAEMELEKRRATEHGNSIRNNDRPCDCGCSGSVSECYHAFFD